MGRHTWPVALPTGCPLGSLRRMLRFSTTIARLLTLTVLLMPGAGSAPAAAIGAMAPGAALSPQEAPLDRERLWSNGCIALESRTVPGSCIFGVADSSFTLALVGDSHMSHLFAGFERLAWLRGWRLVVYTKVSCPFLDIPIRNFYSGKEYVACATWNRNVLLELRALKPDLTVTVAFRGIHPMDPAKETATREGAAIGRMLKQVPGRRAIIVDTPYSLRDIPTCLEGHPKHPDACMIPAAEVLSVGVRTRERAAADLAGATYLDLTSAICGGFPCRVIRQGVVMFRDSHHLTNTYAATLRDVLGAAMDRALD